MFRFQVSPLCQDLVDKADRRTAEPDRNFEIKVWSASFSSSPVYFWINQGQDPFTDAFQNPAVHQMRAHANIPNALVTIELGNKLVPLILSRVELESMWKNQLHSKYEYNGNMVRYSREAIRVPLEFLWTNKSLEINPARRDEPRIYILDQVIVHANALV
jgi:hypothetical protein